MFTQRNVQNLLIGGADPVALSGNDLDTINIGEVGVFTTEGVRVTNINAPTTNKFVIGTKLPNGKILRSDVIEKSKIQSLKSSNSVAATEQIDAVGFNGTAGSIDAINDNLYFLNIYIEEFINANTDGKHIKHAMYKSSLSATQEEIALGIAKSGIKNFNRETEKYILFEVLNSALAGVETAPGTAGTANFTKNSNLVQLSGALPGIIAVGDLIRIGSGPTNVVYKIVNTGPVANSYELDRPYQGATGAVLAAAYNFIDAASFGADWGVRLTGQPLSFVVGKQRYEKARWTLSPRDFGVSTVTNIQGATRGSGQWEQVSELEWFTFGNEGEVFRKGEPTIFDFRNQTDNSVSYALVNITWIDDSESGFSKPVSPKVLTLAVPDQASLAAYATSAGAGASSVFTDVLADLDGQARADLAL